MKDHPIIKIALIFVAGIASAKIIEMNIYFVGVIFSICIVQFFVFKKFQLKPIYLTSFLAAALFFLIGNLLASYNPRTINQDFKKINKSANTTVSGKINKIDLIRKEELILYLTSDSIYSKDFFVKDEIVILCKLSMNESTLREFYDKLKPGNTLQVTGFYYKGRDKRNPGEFDYNAYLSSKGIAGILKITDPTSLKIISGESDLFKNTLHQLRKGIDYQLKKYHNQETFSLLRGLLLADRGEINYETKTHFINAGVVHVLAVSGLNVGFIVLIFLLSLGRLNLFVRSGITIAGLLFYMILTGSPASVFRATIMAVAIIIAFMTNRSNHLINSIALAALVVLIFDPNELYDAGFQLSFSAVISMALFYPPMEALIKKYSPENKFFRYLFLTIGLSLSAQIGTLPFTFFYFSKFSTVSPLTNLIVIPAIGLITGIGIITLIVSTLIPFIAIYMAETNNLITSLIFYLINFSGSLEYSYIAVNDYSFFDFTIFYLFLVVLILLFRKFQNSVSKIILSCFIVINIFLFSSLDDKELLPDKFLSIIMIDVGQGDSFLIKFPNGKTALVDAGNATSTFDNGERVILPLLNYLGIKKIDYGIVSHIDSDHYGGFVALVLSGMIEEIYKTELDTSLSKDCKFENFLHAQGVKLKYIKHEKIEIGNAVLYFLHDESIKNSAGESTNDRSELFKLVYRETSFLFTGDMGKKIENLFSDRFQSLLDSDVLKVAHHGSKTSTSEFLLENVSPEYSLISAGFKNKFGHPADEVLYRLNESGTEIFRTDLQSAVILVSDGKTITFNKWKNNHQ